MARDRDAADITKGSLWPGHSGGSARVLAVSAGYVRFMDDAGAVHVEHHWRFRERFVSPAQVARETRLKLAAQREAETIKRRTMREQFRSIRERFLDSATVQRSRSQFSMSLANLANFHAFWSPTLKRMFARNATMHLSECARASRGRPALPPDAIHVGTYSHPVSTDAFFEDLNDVLATEGNSGPSAI
jgi:hypothetical protein